MTMDIALVFIVLFIAAVMFSTEKVRNDIAAIIIMLALTWLQLLTIDEAFSGFSSNAVISVMGVMIIGYGIEKTGLMDSLANMIIDKVGTKENRVIAITSATVGVMSSFLQNIGAVALFLPAVKKISSESGISPQRVIMPMGFAGILGGTLTMVASGPLIILNDLLKDAEHDAYGLFEVTPIGVALLLSGVIYFYFLAGKILPGERNRNKGLHDELLDIYNLPKQIYEVDINNESKLIENSIEELNIWQTYEIHILGVYDSGSTTYIPWRKTRFNKKQTIAVFGDQNNIEKFLKDFSLEAKKQLEIFSELENKKLAGFAEIILPPDSTLAGKTLREIAIRKNYKIEPIIYIDTDGNRLTLMEREMKSGIKLIVFGRWEDIISLKESKEFVVITEVENPEKENRSDKKYYALGILGFAIALILLGFPLPLSFFTGAILMIFTGVLYKEELYKAINWKTVFLLAGLIPLGIAFEKSGAAKLTAETIIGFIENFNVIFIIFIIGIVTAVFSLFMSNVGATVLLVPLILIMSENFGIDPRAMALFVAVSASNSFIIPTHQVNAYIMGPGNYKTGDYLKTGGLLSVLFLIVSTTMVYFFYI